MSDVQNAAAEGAAPKREAKNYEGMTKASAVADFQSSMEKNGLVLRVTKGELAAAAAALRGEKDFEGAPSNKAKVVEAIVLLGKAVKQKEFDANGPAKNAKGEEIFHKGAKGLDHLAATFGERNSTRNIMFDPAGAVKVLNAVKGDENVVSALKAINEARAISGNRAQAFQNSRNNAKAKASAGAEIGG